MLTPWLTSSFKDTVSEVLKLDYSKDYKTCLTIYIKQKLLTTTFLLTPKKFYYGTKSK